MAGAGPGLHEVNLGAGVRAAFTTVRGGASTAPWAGLNLGLNTGDDPERVLANRAELEAEFGVPITFATQVHGTQVGHVRAQPEGEPSESRPLRERMSCGQVDAIVLTRSASGVAVLVADCVPVLIADAQARVGAVVHAGRVGLVAGVVEAAIEQMVHHGARSHRMRAVIGPAACGSCYEVPEQMRSEVSAQIPQTASRTRGGTPALDLPAGVEAKLQVLEVAEIQRFTACTIEDEEFYSYRRANRESEPTGRFAGVLAFA